MGTKRLLVLSARVTDATKAIRVCPFLSMMMACSSIAKTAATKAGNLTMLNPKAETWFESRAICPEVVARLGIYSARRGPDGVKPDPAGDIIAFPFFENGKVVKEKYRGRPNADGSKNITQRTDPKATFYNADALDDPALIEGTAALVIVEGEPDCLAVLTAGYPFVVSVPDGAPPAADMSGNEPVAMSSNVDLETDSMKFVFNNWDRLKKIKRFVLFGDDDGPGYRLRDELARRLGAVRCSYVRYPDCKGKKADANEILIQLGPAAIVDAIANAVPMPVRGLYRMNDFPPEPHLNPVSTGFGRLDLPVQKGMAGLMPELGLFMTVLGLPESGKSTWTTQLATNLAKAHKWNIAIATFEMRRRQIYKLLQAAYSGKDTLTRQEWDEADKFINDRFTFIHNDSLKSEDDPTIEWILDCADDAVIRDDINVLIIDPWNEADHIRKQGETLTEYTGRAIKKIKRFAQSRNVLVIVVIHPTKEGALKDALSLYDAADSAHWVNKADLAVLINRDYENGTITLKVGKVRYRVTGQHGETQFVYIPELEIFSQ
jgi:twinkle protein